MFMSHIHTHSYIRNEAGLLKGHYFVTGFVAATK